jgi:peroxiredoxin
MTELRTETRPPLEGNLIPALDLPRAGGGRVRLRAYRGRRSLVLYFLHDAGCAGCRDIVASVVPRYGDYSLADAEPLVILPGPEEAAASLRRELALPFPVLVDVEGAAGRRYGVDTGGRRSAALLVADRFGAPALWRPAGAGHDLPDQDAVVREIEYLARTCGAECTTPIWPEVIDA